MNVPPPPKKKPPLKRPNPPPLRFHLTMRGCSVQQHSDFALFFLYLPNRTNLFGTPGDRSFLVFF
jgi:hypothetical protein